jgi:protein-S-isoprenylcysteine O-methyltransferase Ste14
MEATVDPDQIKRVWIRQIIFVPIFFALLLAPAWSLDYWQAWVYGCAFLVTSTGIGIYFLKRDPKVIARRMKVGPAAEREPAQKIIMTLVLAGFVLLLVVPGFDHRWHWSSVPAWLVLVADVFVVLGLLGTALVVKQNSYAAATITVESGQPVVSSGLYAIVRHPMYSAALVMTAFTPPALGSYWGLLLVIPIIAVLAWRLLDEEHVLLRDLPGYADYRTKVTYRLIPGVW